MEIIVGIKNSSFEVVTLLIATVREVSIKEVEVYNTTSGGYRMTIQITYTIVILGPKAHLSPVYLHYACILIPSRVCLAYQ